MTPLFRCLPILLLFFALAAWADEPTVVLRPLDQPGASRDLAKTLLDTWSHLWSSSGFIVVDGSEAHPARFEAKGVLTRDDGNLVLQVTVTDIPTYTIVATAALSVYEGLTAIDPIRETLTAVTRKADAHWQAVRDNPLPVPPLVDPLSFTASDEGAEVFWQGHQSVGVVTDGALVAPYYPFPSNAVLTLTIEKQGYTTRVIDLALDPGTLTYTLPPLTKLRIEELHVFNQLGRLLGAGAEYRNYFVPDWAFWSGEVYPFVQYRPDVKGSRPVLHLDTGASVGTWLSFPAASWFRFGVQSSVWLSQTVTVSSQSPGWYLDAIVVPFGVLMEWNLWGVTLENRFQVPYSVGLPTGLIPAQWVLLGGTVPMVSLGTVFKW